MSYGNTIKRLKSHCGPYACQIQQCTGLNGDQLAEEIFAAALDLIAASTLQKELANSRAFWGWFKMQWYSTDAQYLHSAKPERRDKASYLAYHYKQLERTVLPNALREEIAKEIKQNTLNQCA